MENLTIPSPIRLFPGSGSGLEKIMDPFPVCPERLDPDPVNIRPDPKPWLKWN